MLERRDAAPGPLEQELAVSSEDKMIVQVAFRAASDGLKIPGCERDLEVLGHVRG
jgi:hypothetical protein